MEKKMMYVTVYKLKKELGRKGISLSSNTEEGMVEELCQ